ncbi:unnamed protein product, partial [Ascophyllum nodosum]
LLLCLVISAKSLPRFLKRHGNDRKSSLIVPGRNHRQEHTNKSMVHILALR